MTRPAVPLGEALARGPLVLDGGLSDQLEAQGCDLSGELWSARLLADDPAQLEAAHAAYVRAGARVLITASYQASYEGFARAGIGPAGTEALVRRSVAVARRAAGTAGADPVWVAASVGPYGAVQADGGEYRGRYGLSVRRLKEFHRPRIAAAAAAEPDVLALETVPDADEAEALVDAARECGVPVWLSYTVRGGRTRAGQPLPEAFAVAADADHVVAVGVNCCAPEEVDDAVEAAAAATGRPVVVYPNSGERWLPGSRTWGGPSRYAAGRPGGRGPGSWAAGWVAAGARLVGGCCRTGPEVIARLAGEPVLGGAGTA